MEIEIKIDKQYSEPKVVICTAEMNEAVQALLQRIGGPRAGELAGFQGGVATILAPPDILRMYAEQQRVYAEAGQGIYLVRLRLYEAESMLESHRFVRISNSEIINLRKVKNMDLSLSGTICVKLVNGHVSYVSRRYVSKIKALLGL